MKSLLSVIIPAYNEERTLSLILDRVFAVDLPEIELDVIVVDDCSTDGTRRVMEEYMDANIKYPLRLFNQSRNRGKGSNPHRILFF